MRIGILIFALACIAGCDACSRTGTKLLASSSVTYAGGSSTASSSTRPAADKAPEKVDFQTQIRPVLQAKCQPCHFSGGQVYQRMPFDRPETIKTLGTKLFTRIRDENERRLIRNFLAQ
ncbi:MAG TPA: hypothetical protein VIF64_09985 [Pyrinomonadaceae bacterium]